MLISISYYYEAKYKWVDHIIAIIYDAEFISKVIY